MILAHEFLSSFCEVLVLKKREICLSPTGSPCWFDHPNDAAWCKMVIVNTLVDNDSRAVDIELTIFPPMSFEQHDDFKRTMLDYVSVKLDNLQKRNCWVFFFNTFGNMNYEDLGVIFLFICMTKSRRLHSFSSSKKEFSLWVLLLSSVCRKFIE